MTNKSSEEQKQLGDWKADVIIILKLFLRERIVRVFDRLNENNLA